MKLKSLLNKFTIWRIGPHSNTWQTMMLVIFIVFISVSFSIWFFWRSLYLPELRNHAKYLGNELLFVTSVEERWRNQPEVMAWLSSNNHISIISDVNEFPTVEEGRTFAGFFTNIIQAEIRQQLGRDVAVHFNFKPTPQLWIQDSAYPGFWLREPVTYYAQYSPSSLFFFLIGIPIFTLITILFLVRQLHRPLRKLQQAATNYIRQGNATTLPTHKGPIEIRQVNMAFNRLFTTLSQAQKERTIMLAGISHDLRTPLTRMRLTAEMLPDEFLREGLIYDIEDMDAILEQFISFMKDGSDEPIRLTDLNSIINEITVQFAPIKFVYNYQVKDLVPIRPLSIKRLIINLVNNAIRYGEPPIFITTSIAPNHPDDSEEFYSFEECNDIEQHSGSQSIAKTKLVICVHDCGQGVAPEQLKRIMQPFERGESARTTQGSGLGLAIVGRIARLHHGTVYASNHPNGGFKVCVNIPLLLQPDPYNF